MILAYAIGLDGFTHASARSGKAESWSSICGISKRTSRNFARRRVCVEQATGRPSGQQRHWRPKLNRPRGELEYRYRSGSTLPDAEDLSNIICSVPINCRSHRLFRQIPLGQPRQVSYKAKYDSSERFCLQRPSTFSACDTSMPPQAAFYLYNVAPLTLSLRHTSLIFDRAFSARKILMISSSVNPLRLFIVLLYYGP